VKGRVRRANGDVFRGVDELEDSRDGKEEREE
jgi:hypothetical protein